MRTTAGPRGASPRACPTRGKGWKRRRDGETREETGVIVVSALTSLGYIDYTRSQKRVHCFAGPAPADAIPTLASWEVDQVEFVPLDQARRLMHHDQVLFLDRLLMLLKTAKAP